MNEVGEGASCSELYDLLLTGQSISLTFVSFKEAEAFRIRLHQIKTRKEKMLLEIGFLQPEDVQSLVIQPAIHAKQFAAGNFHTYRVSLGKRKRAAVKFYFTILNESGKSKVVNST